MDTPHILLALEDTAQSRAVADRLALAYDIRLDAVYDRADIFKCINDFYYNVIITDDALMECGDITRIIRDSHPGELFAPKPELILLSQSLTQSVVLGDDEPVFVFKSPASEGFLLGIIRKILELQTYRLADADRKRKSADENITLLFNALGLKPYMLGAKYIREAVHLSMHKPEALDAVTKMLYPSLAKKNGVSAGAVERQIRQAINECFAHGDVDAIRTLFGSNQNRDASHITSSQFISCLSFIVSARTELKER